METNKPETLHVSEHDFKTLQKDYKKAVESNQEQFTFKGRPILTSYAKYLIEYLKTKFKQ